MRMHKTAVALGLVALAIVVAAPATAQVWVENNNLGIGIANPTTPLHLFRTAPAQFLFDTNVADWNFRVAGNGNFQINKIGTPVDLNLIASNGNLVIRGSIFTANCSPCVSDYVFEEGYELMSLAELEEFVWRERHLPNVPSQGDVDREGKLDITKMQMRMLEKIEELVLYTIDQQKIIDGQQKVIDQFGARLAALEQRSE